MTTATVESSSGTTMTTVEDKEPILYELHQLNTFLIVNQQIYIFKKEGKKKDF